MKAILMFLVLFSLTEIYSQCGNFRFWNQKDVDSFIIKNPTCTHVTSLYVNGIDITNLRGLKNIVKIDSLLFLENLPKLPNLLDLSNLHTKLGRLVIIYCKNLKSFKGLENITINGDGFTLVQLDIDTIDIPIHIENSRSISISGCSKLVDMNALIIDTVRRISLTDNQELQNLDVFNNVKNAELIYITNCDKLTRIPDFKQLNDLVIFTVESCDNLVDFSSLSQRDIKLNAINLRNNKQLKSLSGLNFRIRQTLGTKIAITNNPLLNDISYLKTEENMDFDSLIIQGNPNLSICSNDWLCKYISIAKPSKLRIADNSGDCLNLDAVKEKCKATSIEDQFLNVGKRAILCFPNPATDQIFFYSEWVGAHFKIYNTQGQLVSSGISNKRSIQVNSLKSDIYFIVAVKNGQSHYQKLVKE